MTTQRALNLSTSDPYSPETLLSEINTLRQELANLRAEFAGLRTASVSSPPPPIAPTTPVLPTVSAIPEVHNDDAHTAHITPVSDATTSRRTLLKWGGLGAAATLTAAGGAALTSQTAHAANGDNLALGVGNTAEHETEIFIDANILGIAGFVVDAQTSTQSTGVWGLGGTQGIGVRGDVTGNGYAVYASAPNGTGVYGVSTTGFGIIGKSSSNSDIIAIGTGRIQQVTSGSVGAPTSGNYVRGEQIRDANGDLYICITNGMPGVWRKVAAGIPGVSGAINFLANPIRLLDTRTSSAWLAGSTHTLQVTGVAIGGISVPTGAIGVIGNVTVVQPTGSGDLRLYPGPTIPSTSSINFATGQIIANGVTVSLNSSGQFNFKVDMPTGTHTHVLFDASGFIL